MSMSNKKFNPTIRELTGAKTTAEIRDRTICRDKLYFSFGGFRFGVSLKDWNALTLSAPVTEML